MSRSSALILLSALIILTPFSGLPSAFRSLLTLVFGVIVLALSVSLRSQEVQRVESATPSNI